MVRLYAEGKNGSGCQVTVERLRRSVKYEEVCLRAYGQVANARQSSGKYFEFYNTRCRHQSLDSQTPDTVYSQTAVRMAAKL